MKRKLAGITLALIVAVAAPAAFAGNSGTVQDYSPRLTEHIRKELVTLPYYGVFDHIAFKVSGDTVELYGHVVRASTRKDAERRVLRLEGIERVVNRIEVLPLSSFDNSIRRRAYRAVFSAGSLYRYSLGANPAVHIVVNRGNITLEGVVANESDKNLAYIAARGVSGAFSVTNNLRVASRS